MRRGKDSSNSFHVSDASDAVWPVALSKLHDDYRARPRGGIPADASNDHHIMTCVLACTGTCRLVSEFQEDCEYGTLQVVFSCT